MPASAKRPQRTRRDRTRSSTTAPADIDESSPSRPSKRRKKTTDTEQPASSDDSSDDQLVSQITQYLKHQLVQASKDHANSIHEANGDGVKAYAKVAAHDWTFYITKLVVNIGRAPEGGNPEASTDNDDENDNGHVHIDLGPGKLVSRRHAVIHFDSKEEHWVLSVKGRNGARVNGQPLQDEACHSLLSGEVLEIGGVEMMFVLPSEISPLQIHHAYLERCGLTERPARREPPIAPAPPDHKRPDTPPPSKHTRAAAAAKSPAVSTPAPVMVGADGIDLSQDENQHIKPQYSYAQMITQAILTAPDGKLNLNGIYNYIMNAYSYYRHQQAAGWQNSIRHNLSLNKAFDKLPRSSDEPGKGMKWQLVTETKEEMVRSAWRVGRGGHRGSSAPSSPNQLNYITQGPRDMASRDTPTRNKRRSSLLVSPPVRSTLPNAQSTPNRSERNAARNATLTADGSPLPRSRRSAAADPSLSSFPPHSPTLTSSYLQDDGGVFVTPAPPRVHPKLAPPSTAQRPSQHMLTSSPAPFWRYADIGSTPLKPAAPYELSPTKPGAGLPAQSSSPPAGDKSLPSSPTRPQRSHVQQQPEPADADEEQTFDLSK